MASFVFGARSLAQLATVSAELQTLAVRALSLSTQDFGIIEGQRSAEDQLKAWLGGKSKLNGIPVGTVRNGIRGTGLSNHQTDQAYDAYPWVGGKPELSNWAFFWPMAEAHRLAAIELGYRIRWGGCWKELHTLAPGIAGLKAAVEDYKRESRRVGRSALLDGPHFEFRGRL